MGKILVCQHVAYELLGTLNPLIKNSGIRIKYINFSRHPDAEPTLEGYNGLVILGGPQNVDKVDRYPHLTHEMKMIEEALKADIPVLGICLGAQLIATVLGAKVGPNKEKEIGWYDVSLTQEGRMDRILKYFKDSEKLFQWHGDTSDIPKGAVLLAESKACKNQGFRYGNKVYAFQFHLEVDEPMIARWLKVPGHVKELEELKGKIDPEDIKKQTPLYIDRLKALSEKTFGEFLKFFGKKEKRKTLPSR